MYTISTNDNEQHQRQQAVESLQQKLANKETEAEQVKAERLKQFLGSEKVNRRGSVMGKWDNSVNASKTISQQQFYNLREQTMTGFRAAGPGFVKKRAGEFERIYMAKMASESAIIAAIRAGKVASIKREQDSKLEKERRGVTPKSRSSNKKATPKFDDSNSINDVTTIPIASFDDTDKINIDDVDISINISMDSIDDDTREFATLQTSGETFYDGSTHIYELKSISSSLQTIFENVLKANSTNQHTVLPCGIYSDDIQPPIEILAVAMKTENDDGEDNSYISVTINVCDGCEGLRNAYGVFKIAVFTPDSNDDDASNSIAFERIIDFQPKNGWDGWESQYPQDENPNSTFHDDTNTDEVDTDTHTDEVGTDTHTDEVGAVSPLTLNNSITEDSTAESAFEEVAYDEDVTNNDGNDGNEDTDEAGGLELYFFSPGDEEPIFNYGRSLCITSGHTMPKYFSPADEGDPSYSKAWTLSDESNENLPDSIKDKVKLNVRSIIAISSSSNCLAIQTTTGSMAVTGTLKSSTSNSQILVRHNTIFEWVRGAAMSGILYKWPIKSKGNFKSRLSAKFFVVRDNEITYHCKRPTSDHFASTSKSFTLTSNSTIATGRHLLLPCLTITTPQDTLWLRTGKNANITQKWIREVRNGIAFNNRKKLFYSKERIESFWHHEADNFNSVSVDGLVLEPGKFMHVALFLLDSSKSLGNGHVTDVNTPYIHSIDLSLNENDRQQYELYSDSNVNAVMSTDIGTKLTSIKILNNLFVFGGDRGYIGIGRIRDFRHGTVVYCTSPIVPFSMSDGDGDTYSSPVKDHAANNFYKEFVSRKGHSPTSTILCLDVIHDAGIFAGGDDNGIVTLWMLEHSIHNITAGGRMILQNVLNVSTLGQNLERHEKICSLQFLSEERSLLITTNERLLYVTLQTNSQGGYYFDSWVELDSVLPDCQAYFTLCIENINGKRSMVLWKIVGEPYFGPGSTPLPGKAEDAIIFRLKYDDLFAHFLTKLQPINV